jgi:hypothetical protein
LEHQCAGQQHTPVQVAVVHVSNAGFIIIIIIIIIISSCIIIMNDICGFIVVAFILASSHGQEEAVTSGIAVVTASDTRPPAHQQHQNGAVRLGQGQEEKLLAVLLDLGRESGCNHVSNYLPNEAAEAARQRSEAAAWTMQRLQEEESSSKLGIFGTSFEYPLLGILHLFYIYLTCFYTRFEDCRYLWVSRSSSLEGDCISL